MILDCCINIVLGLGFGLPSRLGKGGPRAHKTKRHCCKMWNLKIMQTFWLFWFIFIFFPFLETGNNYYYFNLYLNRQNKKLSRGQVSVSNWGVTREGIVIMSTKQNKTNKVKKVSDSLSASAQQIATKLITNCLLMKTETILFWFVSVVERPRAADPVSK